MARVVGTEKVRRIIALRNSLRGGELFGACHYVSSVLNRAYGWEMVSGCYVRPDSGRHTAHMWNRLPDGTMIDGTADQFRGYRGTGITIRKMVPAEYRVDCNCPDEGDYYTELLIRQIDEADKLLAKCARTLRKGNDVPAINWERWYATNDPNRESSFYENAEEGWYFV